MDAEDIPTQSEEQSNSDSKNHPADLKNPLEAQVKDQEMTVSSELDNIVRSLVVNSKITFKSQQRGEAELTDSEKTDIAQKSFKSNKVNFLMKFGKFLNSNQLKFFNQFTENTEPNWEETKIILDELKKFASEQDGKKSIEIKNRRYQALLQLIKDNEYFSEIEMMKRNPLLYEQLVGQYLTDEEKRERDKHVIKEDTTFVKILMEGIERDNAENSRKFQQQKEDNQMEESDSSEEEDNMEHECRRVTSQLEKPSSSRWGEFEEQHMSVTKSKKAPPLVTAQERNLLKDEFVTTMYENFLDGKDDDFDYDSVDFNSKYDCTTEVDQDEEEKYFDSEEPETVNMEENESSEDDLDIYMNALNQHPAVGELTKTIGRL